MLRNKVKYISRLFYKENFVLKGIYFFTNINKIRKNCLSSAYEESLETVTPTVYITFASLLSRNAKTEKVCLYTAFQCVLEKMVQNSLKTRKNSPLNSTLK